MGRFSLLPKEDLYFDLFTQMTLYISSAARELKEMLADKDRDFNEYAQRIKGLEHACDELTHNIPLASTGRSSLPLIAKTFT